MVTAREAATLILSVLIEALFIHVSALVVLRSSKFTNAAIVAVIGSLLGFLAFQFLGHIQWLAFSITLVSWLVVCGSIYRTTWVRALAVGLLAYILWVVTKLVVEFDWGAFWSSIT